MWVYYAGSVFGFFIVAEYKSNKTNGGFCSISSAFLSLSMFKVYVSVHHSQKDAIDGNISSGNFPLAVGKQIVMLMEVSFIIK